MPWQVDCHKEKLNTFEFEYESGMLEIKIVVPET